MLQARGKDPETKSRVLKQLNDGQRALFLFQVLYGHAHNGTAQFFGYLSYLTDQLDMWTALKSAMKYFGDTEMVNLIAKMEQAYASKETPLDELDAQYQRLIPETVRRIGTYIRNNPTEFIQLED
ncbi:MAG: hypothetical protein WCP73_10760 [Eubacteriales bacterium]